jgi:electron transport complex protein RnfE
VSTTFAATSRHAALEANPAWTQLLGLCPLLAVSSSIANALGLALASAMVLIGSNTLIAVLRHRIPQYARLPCFVLIIASFTTVAVLLMQAFAYELYVRIALFIQIIVTNCMILGRAEAFASRQPVPAAFADALGTAAGFAMALVLLGTVRELAATGGLFAGMETLFGPPAADWHISLVDDGILLAALPPGAFIVAGLLLALKQMIRADRSRGSTAGRQSQS